MLFLDLDRFKEVNDRLGHRAGDIVLTTVAERLTGAVRPIDAVARLGGDEFCVALCDHVPLSEAMMAGKRIVAAIEEPIEVEGGEFVEISASIGVAPVDPADRGTDQFFLEADHAMYVAKRRGRGRVVQFDQSIRREVSALNGLTESIRKAVSTQDISFDLRPTYQLDNGSITNFDVIATWHLANEWPNADGSESESSGNSQGASDAESVAPADYSTLARELGLETSLNAATLAVVAKVQSDLSAASEFDSSCFTIDISPTEVERGRALDTIRTSIANDGLDPSRLCLRLTAGIDHASPETVAIRFGAVAALGATFAIDAPLVIQSSARQILDAHITQVRVALADLIAPADGTQNDSSLAVALAESLNLRVVADSAATSEELQTVKLRGATHASARSTGEPVSRSSSATEVRTAVACAMQPS